MSRRPREARHIKAWWTPDPVSESADGETRAALALLRLQAGAADPDALLSCLLDTLDAGGKVVAPDARLRAFCSRLQLAIGTKEKAAGESGLGYCTGEADDSARLSVCVNT